MDASFDAYCAERLGTADKISRRDNAIDKVVISDTTGKPVNLETASVRSFDNSGNVVIRYTVAEAG